MKNYAEEVKRNYENRFDAQGYRKAIEWLACFMVPGEENLNMFRAGVDFVSAKYDQGITTVAFDVTLYVADVITRKGGSNAHL